MYDIFGRVGGPDYAAVQAEVMIRVYNGNVVGDNLWLWRADHTVGGLVYNSSNPNLHGLQVHSPIPSYAAHPRMPVG